jgi:hypothetical protein
LIAVSRNPLPITMKKSAATPPIASRSPPPITSLDQRVPETWRTCQYR